MTEWCSGQRVGLITQRSEVRILVQSPFFVYLGIETPDSISFIVTWQFLNVVQPFGSHPLQHDDRGSFGVR